jgi:hypothetical protein
MSVTIGLARPDFDWLLHTAGQRSQAFGVLKRSLDAEDWASGKAVSMCVVIECDQEEAMALLELATHHRPQALRDIQYGLTAAGL